MSPKTIIKKNCLAAVLLLGSLFTMSQHNNNASLRKIGPCYIIADSTNDVKVLSIVESNDDNVYHYFLQLNNATDLSVTKRQEIWKQPTRPMSHEQIIGKLGNLIWVLTDSLIGYDANTFEIAATETNIVTKNNLDTLQFSRLHNSYLLDEAAQVMYMSTENGDRYKLYADLSLKPDNTSNDAAPDDYNYESAADYKLYDRYKLKYALTCIDGSNSKMFILGSKRETAQVFSYVGTSIFPEQEELRQLSIIPYKQDGEAVDGAKDKPVLKDNTYYKAAFLQSRFFTTAWKSKKDERLIFYYSDTTVSSTVCIALIDTNGNEQWHLNTKLPTNNFSDYLISNNHLFLWFANSKTTTLITIDLTSGKQDTYQYH